MGESFGERGSRRRQMRRVDRRINRLTERWHAGKPMMFDRMRLGFLNDRKLQLQHDFTHRV